MTTEIKYKVYQLQFAEIWNKAKKIKYKYTWSTLLLKDLILEGQKGDIAIFNCWKKESLMSTKNICNG